MTMDVNELEAGRELDALVAEKVMGLTLRGADRCIVPNPGEAGYHVGFHIIERADPEHLLGYVPRYSTEIAAAWRVVEKLQEATREDDDSCLLVIHFTGTSTGYVASFAGCPYDVDGLEATPQKFPRSAMGETAPLAICRAALLSVQPT